jgi:hypothetical protein
MVGGLIFSQLLTLYTTPVLQGDTDAAQRASGRHLSDRGNVRQPVSHDTKRDLELEINASCPETSRARFRWYRQGEKCEIIDRLEL